MASGKKKEEKERKRETKQNKQSPKSRSYLSFLPVGEWRIGGCKACRAVHNAFFKFLLIPDKQSNTKCIIAVHIKGVWGLLFYQRFCDDTSSQR